MEVRQALLLCPPVHAVEHGGQLGRLLLADRLSFDIEEVAVEAEVLGEVDHLVSDQEVP